MLTAVGADQLAGVRPSARTDGGDIRGTWAIAVGGTVEPDLEADQRGVAEEVMHRCAPLRRRSPGDRTRAAHILKGAEAPLWDPLRFSARAGAAHRCDSLRPPRDPIDGCRPAVIAIPNEPGEGLPGIRLAALPAVPVHHGQALAKHMDAGEADTFKNGTTPLRFQECQARQHDDMRRQFE